MNVHQHFLKQVADSFSDYFDEDLRCWSAYNEGIAVAVRRGAPLASYSIHRRCIDNYMKNVIGDSIQSLICSLCSVRHFLKYSFLSAIVRNNLIYI